MTKTELRQLYKSKRQSLSDEEIDRLSKQILENFKSKFSFEHKPISIFLPIERFKEVNTWGFLKNYSAYYYLPVVKSNGLVHVKYESSAQLKITDWGILEPQFGQQTKPNLFDIVLVPLLAYDQYGNRVGYGKGLYDGFLKNCHSHCLFIGLSFFEPEAQAIETIPSDIRLHYCITPNGIHHFGTPN
ncbi:MAG: 5-formyltetrahydrofolate cyclo-ligase [Crocinitomicaceae bacterium]